MMRLTLVLAWLALVAQARQTATGAVYSRAQAERGRARYDLTCQRCHAADLSGGAGSALKGETFLSDWQGLPLARLFERIRTMPPDASPPPADEALDILSYVLSVNGLPAGDPLSIERLEDVRLGAGSATVPDFALVQVLGCVASGTAGEWLVTRATAPVRTTNPEPSPTDEQPQGARGEATFRLLNAYPSPAKLAGQLVEVKGFLIRGAVDAINVTALTRRASVCP
jgi:mono/diheme cytochrome c family protein